MFIRGSGPPFVIIPGLDGHWSWMRPAIDALARHFTVIAFSLNGERDSPSAMDEAYGFDAQVELVGRAIDEAGADRATICGVSYGGWVALRFAAEHADRTTALVLVSAPPPGFEPNATQARHLEAPLRSAPEFVLTSPRRVLPEIVAALPTWRERVRFTAGHLSRLARTGMSPTRMAMRMRVAASIDFHAACRQITAPTLIVTGEPGLDRIVPVEQTRKYLALIPGSESITLDHTGHIGSLTHATIFADAVSQFVARPRPRREPDFVERRRPARIRMDERDEHSGMTFDITGPAGHLEARLDHPATASRAVAVIASPHPREGETMQNDVIAEAAQGLLRVGCAVLRFNYRPAPVDEVTADPSELADYRAALDAAAKKYPGLPIWAVGYSFGAWVAMVSGARDPRVAQLVGISAPVDHYDFSAVRETDKSKILVHGERDAATSVKTIRRFYGELLEPRELVVIDMADHDFDGHTSEVADAIEDLLMDD